MDYVLLNTWNRLYKTPLSCANGCPLDSKCKNKVFIHVYIPLKLSAVLLTPCKSIIGIFYAPVKVSAHLPQYSWSNVYPHSCYSCTNVYPHSCYSWSNVYPHSCYSWSYFYSHSCYSWSNVYSHSCYSWSNVYPNSCYSWSNVFPRSCYSCPN